MNQLNEKPNRMNSIKKLSEVLKYLPGDGAPRRNTCQCVGVVDVPITLLPTIMLKWTSTT